MEKIRAKITLTAGMLSTSPNNWEEIRRNTISAPRSESLSVSISFANWKSAGGSLPRWACPQVGKARRSAMSKRLAAIAAALVGLHVVNDELLTLAVLTVCAAVAVWKLLLAVAERE